MHAAGHQASAPLQEALAAGARGDAPTPEPLTAAQAADGVRGPCRPEAGMPRGQLRWRAGTGGVLARVGQHRTRTGQSVTRLQPRRRVAVLGASETLKARLGLAALRQGMLRAPQGVWLSAGGRGVWRLCAAPCAAAPLGLLDLSHAAPTLWQRAAAWLDGRTTPARRWCAWARHRLRPGPPDGVLADLAEA